MKITKRQLRRIIKEEKAKILNEAPTPYEREEALKFLRQDTGQRHTAMGATAKTDELFDARDNLLGLIEMLNPDEAGFFIEDLIRELQTMQRNM